MLPSVPPPAPPGPENVVDDVTLARQVAAAWRADRAPAEIIGTAYGIYSGLPKVIDSPNLKTSKNIVETIKAARLALAYDSSLYPQSRKIFAEEIDKVTGVVGAAKTVPLTPELRTTYRKLFNTLAEGCRLAL